MRLIDGGRVLGKVDHILYLTDKNQSFYEGCRYMQKRVLKIIRTSKTIDAVPVVRCKDCKHSNEFEDHLVCDHALPTKSIDQYFMVGTDILAIVKPDDFCSYGVRKGGEG